MTAFERWLLKLIASRIAGAGVNGDEYLVGAYRIIRQAHIDELPATPPTTLAAWMLAAFTKAQGPP